MDLTILTILPQYRIIYLPRFLDLTMNSLVEEILREIKINVLGKFVALFFLTLPG